MFARAIRITRPYHVPKSTYLTTIMQNYKHARSFTVNHAKASAQPLRSPQSTASSQPLRYAVDRSLGHVWNGVWRMTTAAYPLFLLRFKILRNENLLFAASGQRARAAFWNAYKNVPAYEKHIGPTAPRYFSDVPETVKEKYIKPYVESQQIHLTLMNGQLPLNGQIDTSTGTSGRPTPWVRGSEEMKTVQTLANFAAQIMLGNNPVILINAFALGPWATGITVSNVMRKRALMFSTGPDKEKILSILQQFPPQHYPGLRYVISGYPPFMKDLAEAAIKNNVNLDQYGITAIVGGEEISDAIRQQALGFDQRGIKIQPGFERIISTYGASDLDINIGYETDFEIALRAACRKNPALARDLLGANEPVPMMFHYDPLNYYIETNAQQDLIFTCVRNDRVSPRIRYNLKDRGKIMPISEVLECLEKHEVNIMKPNTTLPLLFVWGRDGTLNYRGAKVPATHLEEAINNMPELSGKIQNFAFNSYENNSGTQVEMWLELKSSTALNLSESQLQQLTRSLIQKLTELNQDFKFQITNAPQHALPTLRVFPFGESPMSNQDPQRKKKYIYQVNPSDNAPAAQLKRPS